MSLNNRWLVRAGHFFSEIDRPGSLLLLEHDQGVVISNHDIG